MYSSACTLTVITAITAIIVITVDIDRGIVVLKSLVAKVDHCASQKATGMVSQEVANAARDKKTARRTCQHPVILFVVDRHECFLLDQHIHSSCPPLNVAVVVPTLTQKELFTKVCSEKVALAKPWLVRSRVHLGLV